MGGGRGCRATGARGWPAQAPPLGTRDEASEAARSAGASDASGASERSERAGGASRAERASVASERVSMRACRVGAPAPPACVRQRISVYRRFGRLFRLIGW